MPPPGDVVSLSDVLEIDLEVLDQVQEVRNLTTRKSLFLTIKSTDVEDLRMPDPHGRGEYPPASLARRKEQSSQAD